VTCPGQATSAGRPPRVAKLPTGFGVLCALGHHLDLDSAPAWHPDIQDDHVGNPTPGATAHSPASKPAPSQAGRDCIAGDVRQRSHRALSDHSVGTHPQAEVLGVHDSSRLLRRDRRNVPNPGDLSAYVTSRHPCWPVYSVRHSTKGIMTSGGREAIRYRLSSM